MKKHPVYLIGNAHLDPVWLWRKHREHDVEVEGRQCLHGHRRNGGDPSRGGCADLCDQGRL